MTTFAFLKNVTSNFKPQIAVGFGVTFVVFVFLVWMSYANLTQFLNANQWQAHTLKTLDLLSRLQVSLYEARSEQRGFILMRDPSYLIRYRRKCQFINDSVRHLAEQIQGDWVSQQHLQKLKPLIQEQIDFMDVEIKTHHSLGRSLTEEKELWDRGKNQISKNISQINQDEVGLLQQREANVRSSAYNTFSFLIISVGFIMLLLCLVYYLINREILLREKAESEVRVFNKELEQRIEERTEALLESEARFRRIADSAPVMIFVTDKLGGISYWNNTWFHFVGQNSEEHQAWEWKTHLHPDNIQLFMETYVQALDTHHPFKTETRLRQANGQYRWVVVTGIPKFSQQGDFMGFLGSCMDITEQKTAKEIAEEASKRKSQFLANMSHELRTPLNAVIGYSELMLSGMAKDLEKQQKYANAIFTSGHHLLDMVNDLLDIATIEAGKLQLDYAYIKLQPFMVELQSIFADQIQRKQLQFNLEIEPNFTEIYIDRARFKQILLNLVSNAIKFNNVGGYITVRFYYTKDQQQVVCEVEDSGIGIPKDKLPELFQEFYQVDASYSRQHEGTGLGLVLTKRLVEMQGGRISFESKEGVGSTFTIYLPVNPEAEADVQEQKIVSKEVLT